MVLSVQLVQSVGSQTHISLTHAVCGYFVGRQEARRCCTRDDFQGTQPNARAPPTPALESVGGIMKSNL